jgi:type IV/VI secretion system ImpK/VasF family protein
MHDDVRWNRIKVWKPVRQVFQAADELFDEADRLRSAAENEVTAGEPPPEPAAAPARGKPSTPPEPAAATARGKPPSTPPGKSAAPPSGKTPAPAGKAPASSGKAPAPSGKAAPPAPTAPPAYLRLRRAVREAIEAELDPEFTEHLGSWQKHMCVIAIASFIDERERVRLGGLAETWRLPLLQTELLEIDDGGDRFFTQLGELLSRADVHELVFEVHLLCLRAGFVGRYRDRRHEIENLVGIISHRLRQHEPRRALMVVPEPPQTKRRRVGFVGFPLRYYIGALVAVIGLFATLRIVSARDVERSALASYCHHDGKAP